MRSAWSQALAWGTIRASANSRNAVRSCCCSGVSSINRQVSIRTVLCAGGLSLYQLRHVINALEFLELEVLIGNGDLEIFFQEQHKLHGKQRVDKPGRENLVVIGNRPAVDVPPQKSPQFFFRLLHEFLSLQD